MKDLEIIIIRESLIQSIAKDIFSFLVLFAMVVVGVAIDSPAMEWVGGVLALLVILSKSMAAVGKDKRMTIQQARERLDEMDRIT